MKQGCRTSLLIFLLVAVVFGMGMLAIALFVSKGRTEMFAFPSRSSVAIIEVEGPIFDVEGQLRELKGYVRNSSVKALVVRVNSPGGSVAASQEMFEELNRAKDMSPARRIRYMRVRVR